MKWSNFEISAILNKFKEYPVLWDQTLTDYRNRSKRESAMMDFLSDVRTLPGFEEITSDILKSKIKILRTTYKQEVTKIENSKKRGAGLRNIYKPKLSWFNDADCFLKNVTVTRKSSSNMDSSWDQETILKSHLEILEEEEELACIDTDSSMSSEPPRKVKKQKVSIPANNYKRVNQLSQAVSQLENTAKSIAEENEYVKFGQYIAAQLQKLSIIGALEAQAEITSLLSRKRIEELKNGNLDRDNKIEIVNVNIDQ